MRPASFEWFVLISAGILLIALSKRLAQMYLIGYEKTAKWLFGPLSCTSRLHLWWVVGGVVLILIGLGEVVGYIR